MFPSFLATNFLSTPSSSWPAFNRSPSVNSALHTITILTKSPNHFFDLNSSGNSFLLLQQSNVSKPVKPNVLAAREKIGFNPSEPSSHCGLCDFRQSVSWQLNLLPIYNLHLLRKTKQPAIYWENATCWPKKPSTHYFGLGRGAKCPKICKRWLP